MIAMMSLMTRLGKMIMLRLSSAIRRPRSSPNCCTSRARPASIISRFSSPQAGVQRATGRPQGEGYSITAWPLPRSLTCWNG